MLRSYPPKRAKWGHLHNIAGGVLTIGREVAPAQVPEVTTSLLPLVRVVC